MEKSSIDSFLSKNWYQESSLQFFTEKFLKHINLNGESSVLFTPGKAIPLNTKSLHTVAVVLVELPLSVRSAIYEYMYVMQILTQRIRFLIITDGDDLRQIRKYGWLVEHIISRESFESIDSSQDWEDMVQKRIISICINLEVGEVICGDDGGIDRIQHNKLCKLTKIMIPYNSVTWEIIKD